MDEVHSASAGARRQSRARFALRTIASAVFFAAGFADTAWHERLLGQPWLLLASGTAAAVMLFAAFVASDDEVPKRAIALGLGLGLLAGGTGGLAGFAWRSWRGIREITGMTEMDSRLILAFAVMATAAGAGVLIGVGRASVRHTRLGSGGAHTGAHQTEPDPDDGPRR